MRPPRLMNGGAVMTLAALNAANVNPNKPRTKISKNRVVTGNQLTVADRRKKRKSERQRRKVNR